MTADQESKLKTSVTDLISVFCNTVTLRKLDSRRHSTTRFSENVVMAEKSNKMLEVLLFAIERGLNLLKYR